MCKGPACLLAALLCHLQSRGRMKQGFGQTAGQFRKCLFRSRAWPGSEGGTGTSGSTPFCSQGNLHLPSGGPRQGDASEPSPGLALTHRPGNWLTSLSPESHPVVCAEAPRRALHQLPLAEVNLEGTLGTALLPPKLKRECGEGGRNPLGRKPAPPWGFVCSTGWLGSSKNRHWACIQLSGLCFQVALKGDWKSTSLKRPARQPRKGLSNSNQQQGPHQLSPGPLGSQVSQKSAG